MAVVMRRFEQSPSTRKADEDIPNNNNIKVNVFKQFITVHYSTLGITWPCPS